MFAFICVYVCVCLIHMQTCGCAHHVCIFKGQVTDNWPWWTAGNVLILYWKSGSDCWSPLMFVCFSLCCERTLCGHPTHLLVGLGWFFCSKQAAPLAPAAQPAAQHPQPWARLLLVCRSGWGRGGSRIAPGSGSLAPVFCCGQPPRHHPAGFLEPINIPPLSSPYFVQPRIRSVCFHHAEMHTPPASRGLISSNGGGGCPRTTSRSCPLLAASRMAPGKDSGCGCCLREGGSPESCFPEWPWDGEAVMTKDLLPVLEHWAAPISPS